MSFGFSVGDFVATGQLVWTLYRDYYRIARVAGHEVELLATEINTLRAAIEFLREEIEDENSILRKSGEGRVRMVNDMMSRVKETVLELETVSKKYQKLKDDKTRPKWKRIGDKVRYSIDARDLEGLRNKLVYHNSLLNLLLTSVGNSSLQRLGLIEASCNEIKDRLGRLEAGNRSLPRVSHIPGLDDDDVFRESLSAALLKNAEARQPWESIGLADWIRAGRWWLLKAQMELRTSVKSSQTTIVSRHGYLSLVKASWILVSVIIRHPQHSYLNNEIQFEVKALTVTITEEFHYLETHGQTIPSIDPHNDDLQIWETLLERPVLQPGVKSKEKIREWAMPDEYIMFQRFAQHQGGHQQEPIPSLVLLLVNKRSKQPRLIIHDQHWRCLAEYKVESFISCKHMEGTTDIEISGQRSVFRTSLDSGYLHVLLLAYGKYIPLYIKTPQPTSMEIDYALILLAAMTLSSSEIVTYVREMEYYQQYRENNSGPHGALFVEIMTALEKRTQNGDIDNATDNPRGYEYPVDLLVSLMLGKGYHNVVKQLLKEKGLNPPEEGLEEWLSPYNCVNEGRTEVLLHLLQEGMPGNFVCRKRRLLAVAAECGNEVMVQLLLDRGGDTEAKDDDTIGGTPLTIAAREGHESIVQLLLDRGAGIETRSTYCTRAMGYRPLHYAAAGGHDTIVRLLLNRGAYTDQWEDLFERDTPLTCAARNGHGSTVLLLLNGGARIECGKPLQEAARNGREQIVRLLLDRGAKLEAWRSFRSMVPEVPLDSAAENGHESIVQLLLDRGAQIEWGNPLYKAASNGHEPTVRLLIDRGAYIETKDSESGRTPLNCAAESGYESTIRLLLDRGADIESEDKHHRTPLSNAAGRERRESIIRLLLDHGANIEAKDSSDKTALYYAAANGDESSLRLLLDRGSAFEGTDPSTLLTTVAARKGQESIIQLLLDRGANIEIKNNDGTPLHIAALYDGMDGAMQLLLDRGANIEAKDKSGHTPLINATLRGRESNVSLLINRGANIEAKDNDGRTPLNNSANLNLGPWTYSAREAIFRLLLDCGADIETTDNNCCTPLLNAAGREGQGCNVQVLLDRGANIEAKDDDGRTPLIVAAHEGHESSIQILLDRGAKIEARDDEGRTPLIIAADRKGRESINIIQLLLDRGANIEAKDNNECTPLGMAVRDKENQPIVRLLLDRGANTEARDKYGVTPLIMAARQKGNQAVVKLLLDYGASIEALGSPDFKGTDRALLVATVERAKGRYTSL